MVDWRYLTDGKLSGQTNLTVVFYTLTRVDGYPWWQPGRTGATPSPAMAKWRRCVVVRWPLLATAMPSEKRMSSTVTKRIY